MEKREGSVILCVFGGGGGVAEQMAYTIYIYVI
jgi:hypothetical protein